MNTNSQKIGIELLLARFDRAYRAGLKPVLNTVHHSQYRHTTYLRSRRGAHWDMHEEVLGVWTVTTLTIPGENQVYAEHYEVAELGSRQTTMKMERHHAAEHDREFLDGERVVAEN